MKQKNGLPHFRTYCGNPFFALECIRCCVCLTVFSAVSIIMMHRSLR